MLEFARQKSQELSNSRNYGHRADELNVDVSSGIASTYAWIGDPNSTASPSHSDSRPIEVGENYRSVGYQSPIFRLDRVTYRTPDKGIEQKDG